jgi:hypothetical protein
VWSATALAAEPKPDISVKTQYIEASVTLDQGIKTDAALAENCLTEGKRWVEKYRKEAAGEFKSSPELFRDGRAWTFEREYIRASVVADRYVSVLRNDFFYTGGAHPNRDIDTILWDGKTKKRISIRPFFTETADGGPTMKAMLAGVIESLAKEKKARDTDTPAREWARSLSPKLLGIGAVALAPSTIEGKSSGLAFHYPPYAVGAYAEGSYDAFVPWQALKPYLSAAGAAIFAGFRPKSDETGK